MVQTDEESSKILWCGNLHEKVSEELLYELFLQAGPLEKVKIVTPATGTRYAFITFKHTSSVTYTLNLMNGIRLFDKPLRLQMRNAANNTQSGTSSCPATPVMSVRPNLMVPSTSVCPPPSPLSMIRYPPSQFSCSSNMMPPSMPIRHSPPVGFSEASFVAGLLGVRPLAPIVGFHRSYSVPEKTLGDERFARRTDSPSGDHNAAPYHSRQRVSRHHESFSGSNEHASGRHESDYNGHRLHYNRDRHHHHQQQSNQDFRQSNRNSYSRRDNRH